MLTASAMSLVSKANIWQASFIGSLAAGCQVGRVGNIPLQYQELLNAFRQVHEQ
jgi:bifunctional ADP-heptose synthase (sugar kinase/adenylyltransferase)